MALKEEVNLTMLHYQTTDHCVCAQVTAPCSSFYAISCYFQFADFNAKSLSWGGRVTDEENLLVTEFIMQNDLILLNDPA